VAEAVLVQRAVVRVTAATALLLRILVHLLLMPVAAVAVETHQPRFLVDLVAAALVGLVIQEVAHQAQQILAVAEAARVCNIRLALFSQRAETVVLVL
jgi:hypothetical protein